MKNISLEPSATIHHSSCHVEISPSQEAAEQYLASSSSTPNPLPVQTSPNTAMAVAITLHHTFLTSNPLSLSHHQSKKPHRLQLLSCRSSLDNDGSHGTDSSRAGMQLTNLAIVTFAAGVLTLGSVGDALAAKSGGRVGGQAFRSTGPRPSGPRINNSRTNIYINPPVAPPLVGGYGYGVPFGGWGWSPFTFFAPGPSVAVGVGGGFDFFAVFLVLGIVATVVRSFRRNSYEDEDDF